MLVGPRLTTGGRPVLIDGRRAGVAHSPGGLMRLMEDVGYRTDLDRVGETSLIEWAGGGIETW